jgi:biopolymer transport protein ExbD
MGNLLILTCFIFIVTTMSVEAQFIPYSNPFAAPQFDYYIEKRAQELYEKKLNDIKKSDPYYYEEDSIEEEEISVKESSYSSEQETEVIICYYDKNREYQCDPIGSKDKDDD